MATSWVVIINHFLPTHTQKKETSEGVAFRSTAAADMLVGSLAVISNRRAGEGLLELRQHVDSVTGSSTAIRG